MKLVGIPSDLPEMHSSKEQVDMVPPRRRKGMQSLKGGSRSRRRSGKKIENTGPETERDLPVRHNQLVRHNHTAPAAVIHTARTVADKMKRHPVSVLPVHLDYHTQTVAPLAAHKIRSEMHIESQEPPELCHPGRQNMVRDAALLDCADRRKWFSV